MGEATPGPQIPPEGEPKISPGPAGGAPQAPLGGEEPTRAFKPLMEEGTQAAQQQAPSPLDLAKGGGPIGAAEATPATLQAQSETLGKKIQLLQGEMTNERYGELTPGQRALVDAKTGQLSDHVGAIAKYTGTEGPPKLDAGLNQLQKWLGSLTGAQHSLATATDSLSVDDPSKISASGMMRVQARLMAADRTINFVSAVVGKSVDFIKMIFQMQI